MKRLLYLALAAAALFAASCTKTPVDTVAQKEGHNLLTLEIRGVTTDDLDTRITLDGWKPIWTGNEKMQVLFGNASSSSAATSHVAYLDQTSAGVFSGTIDMGTFSEDDIQGVIVGPEAYFKYDSGKNRITMPIAYTQLQSASGVFNGDNFPYFAEFSSTMFGDDEGKKVVDGVVLRKGHAVVAYNVYGEHEDMAAGEKLMAISINSASEAALCGTCEYRKSDGMFTFSGTLTTYTVQLENGFDLTGSTVSTGAKVYQAVLGRADGTNSSKTGHITKLTVMTDKATYTKDLTVELSPVTGKVHQYNVNLASGFTRTANIQYSVDGGSTWLDEIPASFSALKVKSTVAGMTEEELQAIAAAVKAQSGNVDVDFSSARVKVLGGGDAEFPAVFGNETAADAVLNLHTIVFPSNVTAVAANAFRNCTALESINLSKITTIGGSAFRSTGLVNLTVPETVTSIGNYAFGYCWQLQTLYYDSPAHSSASGNTYTFACRNTAAVADLPSEYAAENLIPLTATFGPHAVIGNYDFDTNHKVVKMVFEAKPTVKGSAWFIRCRYLKEFDFIAVTSPVDPGKSNSSQTGVLAADGTKKIYVPTGCSDAYLGTSNETWKYLVDNNGYQIVEKSDVQYSVDGGVTWMDDITDLDFTTLAVKGHVFASHLDAIKVEIDKQTGVALDMSASVYSSETFPAKFKGATVGGTGNANGAVVSVAGSPVTSMVFPSNITAIEASAFLACDKLTSVDLTGMVSIGASAFRATGLTEVTVPASVTTCGSYSFGYCPDLATITFNSAATNNHVFSWRSAGDNANNVASKPTTVTFGPGVNLKDGQCFDTNHKLAKVIFTGDPASVGSGWIIRCTSIHTFDLRACTKAVGSSSSNLGTVGDDVTGDKVIIVADGLKEKFAANTTWGYLANNKGYTIKSVSELE